MFRKAVLFERQLSSSSTESVPEFSGSMDTLKSYYSSLKQCPEGPYGRRGSASHEFSPYIEPEWECIGCSKDNTARSAQGTTKAGADRPTTKHFNEPEMAFVSRPNITPVSSPTTSFNSPRQKRFTPMASLADDRIQRPY